MRHRRSAPPKPASKLPPTRGTEPKELLARVPLFAAIDEPALTGLAAMLRRRAFPRNMVIFHRDQVGDALYVIESGRVRIFLSGEGGEELTVHVLGPGDVFGELSLLDGRPRSASARTIEEVVTYTLSRDDFQAHLRKTPGLAPALIALLSDRLRRVTEYAESLAFLDLHGRLARLLLELAGSSGPITDGEEVEFAFTQSDLASMVGATRERVNRALAAFRSQGLVEVKRGRLRILDADRLRRRIY